VFPRRVPWASKCPEHSELPLERVSLGCEEMPQGGKVRRWSWVLVLRALTSLFSSLKNISGKKRKSSTRTGLGHQVPFRPKTLSCGGRRAETRGRASNKKEKVETTKKKRNVFSGQPTSLHPNKRETLRAGCVAFPFAFLRQDCYA
jgi:hypothetical protein